MLFFEALSLLFFTTILASAVDLEFHCSIVHNFSIPVDRKIFSSTTNILETKYPNDDEQEEVCIIASVAIYSVGSSVSFPSYRSIELFYPAIPFIGPNLFRQFDATTVNLELRKGTLKELYYGLSHLERLHISDTGLQTFDVLPVLHGSLQVLVIHEPQIEKLPANIRYLVGLKVLDLSGCALTSVDLGNFESLVALNVLRLADNRLTTVTVGSELTLPNLILFDARQNRLLKIDRFPDMFPALKYTRIMQNQWDCEWVSAIREKVWLRNITVLGNDFRCVGRMSNGGLCCSYSSPARARLAISKAMLAVLGDLNSSGPREHSVKEGLKLQVYENETVDGVIGLEMENVGIYLQDPINKV
uniref:Uncharacterized protein n=1 Tax=Anopheles atroparvus TaxID=41427 RepID=A0A240PKL3_ANOAO